MILFNFEGYLVEGKRPPSCCTSTHQGTDGRLSKTNRLRSVMAPLSVTSLPNRDGLGHIKVET